MAKGRVVSGAEEGVVEVTVESAREALARVAVASLPRLVAQVAASVLAMVRFNELAVKGLVTAVSVIPGCTVWRLIRAMSLWCTN